jgi:hypothetical protein
MREIMKLKIERRQTKEQAERAKKYKPQKG